MKIKNKNLRKYKITKFIFFKSKLNKKNKNPEKSGQNPENPEKIRKSKKIIQKLLKSFQKSKKIIFGFSLTHSGGSSVPLGTIINSSRTNPRFGPSFK